MLCCSKAICSNIISPKLIVKNVINTVPVNKYIKKKPIIKHISINITLLTFIRIDRNSPLSGGAIEWECSGQKNYIGFGPYMNCFQSPCCIECGFDSESVVVITYCLLFIVYWFNNCVRISTLIFIQITKQYKQKHYAKKTHKLKICGFSFYYLMNFLLIRISR